MAAKKGAVPLFVLLTLIVSSTAVASIPRSDVLSRPSIDRYATEEAIDPSSIDNARLLHRALARALPPSAPIETLSESRVWVFSADITLVRRVERPLTRSVRRGWDKAWPELAENRTVLTPDPMGYLDSSNLYAFAGGDPVNGRDPTGEFLDAAAIARVAQWGARLMVGVRIGAAVESGGYLVGAGQAGEALAPAMEAAAPYVPPVALGLAIGGAIITPFKIAAIREDTAAYEAEARALQIKIRSEAHKRQRARISKLPGVSPYSQQADALGNPDLANNLTVLHNEAVDGVGVPNARNTRGRVVGGHNLPTINGQWLRGSHGNAGVIPAQVAEKLRGREFASFDDFRAEFWRTVATFPELASQFGPGNQANMRGGFAPFALEEQQLGGQARYIIHHRYPIQHGGAVYDLDNLMVVSPRYHKNVLSPERHY